MEKYTYEQLLDVIAALRGENGCPWDRAQTHESMIPCLRDECEEVIEAIHHKDDENLCEELGDVFLQVLLHAQIAREEGRFDMSDVIDGLAKKMIHLNPISIAINGELLRKLHNLGSGLRFCLDSKLLYGFGVGFSFHFSLAFYQFLDTHFRASYGSSIS